MVRHKQLTAPTPRRGFTDSEAKVHWQETLAVWTEEGLKAQDLILNLPDPALRFTVAALSDALAERAASLLIQEGNDGFVVDTLAVDDDVLDAIVSQLEVVYDVNPDDILGQAFGWYKQYTNGRPITFLGWLFGSLGQARGRKDILRICWDRIYYDLQKQLILGVATADDPKSPGFRIVKTPA